MKIGIFDSGLGGLFVAKAIKKSLPQYDYVYLGDTARVPYGNRPQKQIHQFLKQGVEDLFKKDCQLVIVACNSASATALRKIQQQFLKKSHPDRRVLGVIIPTAEAALAKGETRIGILGTKATVKSKAYDRELKKINKSIEIISSPAPLLVPMIESGNFSKINPVLSHYMEPFKGKVNSIILGCTHYGIIKQQVQKIAGPKVKVICQTDVVPTKLKDYLKRHPEIDNKLSKHRQTQFYITKTSNNFTSLAKKWFGKNIRLQLTKLTK